MQVKLARRFFIFYFFFGCFAPEGFFVGLPEPLSVQAHFASLVSNPAGYEYCLNPSLIFSLLLQIPEDHFCRRQVRDERIFQACHLISLSCDQNLQLESLAKKLNMSVSNLCHLFKQETGVSPYIMR